MSARRAPIAWKEAARRLRWQVQRRSYVEGVRLQGLTDRSGPDTTVVQQRLGVHTCLALMLDGESTMAPVLASDLSAWAVTPAKAGDIARLNVESAGPWLVEEIPRGRAIAADDPYAAARYLLDPAGAGLPAMTQPVALVLDRQRVLVLERRDVDTYLVPIQALAATIMEGAPFMMLGEPLAMSGAGWAPCVVSPGSVASAYEVSGRMMRLALEYNTLRAAQRAADVAQGIESVLPTVRVARRLDGGDGRKLGRFALWDTSRTCDLPETDYVGIGPGRGSDELVVVEWADLHAVCGPGLQVRDTYPERWRTLAPPTEKQRLALAALSIEVEIVDG